MVKRVLLLLLLSMLLVLPASAQSTPVANAVFFYSPTCPHCENVITNYLPQWQAEFGDQLHLLMLNVRVQENVNILSATCVALNVPDSYCGSVPMMVIGNEVLVGARDIPERAPLLIRAGLAAGGIAVPPVTGMQALFDAQFPPDSTAPVPNPAAALSLAERLAADPVANAVAIGVLGLLVVGVVFSLLPGWRRNLANTPLLTALLLLTLLLMVGVGISLAAQGTVGTEAATASVIIWSALIAVLIAGALVLVPLVWKEYPKTLSRWAIPLIVLAGTLVALYLANVEVSETEAVCGAMGNCNAVQESAYARLFGVLPIGLLGLFGYATIFLAWIAWQFQRRKEAAVALLLLTLGGAAFSIYLTFLEPFVIGATCAWCLMSALAMLALLLLVAPAGWDAYYALRKPAPKNPAVKRPAKA